MSYSVAFSRDAWSDLVDLDMWNRTETGAALIGARHGCVFEIDEVVEIGADADAYSVVLRLDKVERYGDRVQGDLHSHANDYFESGERSNVASPDDLKHWRTCARNTRGPWASVIVSPGYSYRHGSRERVVDWSLHACEFTAQIALPDGSLRAATVTRDRSY